MSAKLWIIGLVIVGVGMALGFVVTRSAMDHGNNAGGAPNGQTSDLSQRLSQGKCSGQGPVTFSTSPVALADLEYIEPMGAMSGSHVTPTDHQYWRPPAWNREPIAREVFAPADGVIVEIEKLEWADDYRLVIEHSCTFYSLYIHITELDETIIRQSGEVERGKSVRVRVPVSEGDLLGSIYGRAGLDQGRSVVYQLDFSVADTEVILPGLIDPAKYVAEPWKIHTTDPFDYFAEPLKAKLLAKNLRTVKPFGGKIDYDVAGRLIGNWFGEGQGGYGGGGLGTENYWSHHLTIAYDHIDPATVKVSIGDWGGKSEQFVVVGNSPDPMEVGVSSGPVKYELLRAGGYVDAAGKRWDQSLAFAQGLKSDVQGGAPEGVLLVQLIDERRLKAETFIGQRAAAVVGFTPAAVIYER